MKLYYLIILLTILLSVAFSSKAATYYVNDNSTMDDVFCTAVGSNSNTGTSADPFATLSYVVNTVGLSVGDIVYVDAGTYLSTDANLALNVNDVSIIGAGYDLTYFDNDFSSSDGNRWAIITGDNITIQDLYITGYNYGLGGASALQISGASNVTVTNVMVNENYPGGGASAIVIDGGSTVSFSGGGSNCNPGHSSVAGGGVNVEGNGNGVTFYNYTFSANEKDYQGGSGLYVVGDATTSVVVQNSLFSDNVNGSASGGAGMYVSNGADVTVNRSCFNNNSSSMVSGPNYGGAVMVGRTSSVTLTDCTFDGNSAGPSGNGGAVCVNTVFGSGGAADVSIVRAEFINNTAEDGADLYTEEGFSNAASIDVYQATFSGTAEDVNAFEGTITIDRGGNPSNSNATFVNTLSATLSPNSICPTTVAPCFSTLPVELTQFTFDCFGENLKLKWETATEYNNDHFILERSVSGDVFEFLAKVDGSMNSSEPINYTYTVSESRNRARYYRLTQVDVDGRSETFPSISVNDCGNNYSVWYDISTEEVRIAGDIPKGDLEIQILTLDGRVLPVKISRLSDSEVSISLMNRKSSGVHVVKFLGVSGPVAEKLFFQ